MVDGDSLTLLTGSIAGGSGADSNAHGSAYGRVSLSRGSLDRGSFVREPIGWPGVNIQHPNLASAGATGESSFVDCTMVTTSVSTVPNALQRLLAKQNDKYKRDKARS